MNLVQFSVQKKVTVVMVTLGIILVGTISFSRLPQELFPPITFPQLTIVTDYTNAAPEEIETLITKPIEEAVGAVAGLKHIESISREGRSTVMVSFNWGQDIDFAALAVREKIDLIKERLPKEAEDPVVLKFDPLARPILILSVSGQNLEPVQMKYLAEKVIKDNLEKIDGVASATISGGLDREIIVEIDQARLEANHLSLLQVIESIEQANVSYPAGSIKKGLYEYLIRTIGEFRSVKEIGYSVAGIDTLDKIKADDTSFVEKGSGAIRETVDTLRQEVQKRMLEKRLVLIRDIAEVVDGTSEKTSISRHNGKENISISIQKQAGANTVELVDRIRKALTLLDSDISSRGLHYEIIYDHSIFVRRSLEDLMSDAKSGGFLVFLVLFAFLRLVLPSLILILSVPITLFGCFILMNMGGITMNTMSIGGLVLAIGMIVDASIVVLENIFRKREEGMEAYEAAVQGTQEVLWPVITSNLTTIAVFFPLIVFVPGIAGQIFKDLSWTIIYSQVISTLVPLSLIPMLSVYLKVKPSGYKPWTWTRFLEKRLIGEIPRQKKIRTILKILTLTFGLCAVTSFLIFPSLEREVLPKVDQGQFLLKVTLPIGTRLEVTDRVCQRLEQMMQGIKNIKNIAVTIGSEKTEKGQVKVEAMRPSQALILVTLEGGRKKRSAEVVRILEEKIKTVDTERAQIDFVLQESEFAFAEGGIKPVLILVRGYDEKKMTQLVEDIQNRLGQIRGIANIQDDMGEPSPETKLHIDKSRAALYGISALDISLIAKAGLEGVVATEYREAGKEYDVRVRLSERDRSNIENLNSLLLYSQVLDTLISLKEVAKIERSLGPSEIKRLDQERTATVSADILGQAKSKDVLVAVQKMLAGLSIPEDFQVQLSGKAKEVKENFAMVIFAFVLAVILNYMIMASQFESFMQPLLIMITVPLALFGVGIALWISGTSLNVISLLGMVLLAGTAVNNGIVLIEYINQLREQGMDVEEAALESAKIRTRPILMSALTSILGLVPLALGLGEGAELRSPMAIAMMGGTLSSTVLTLIVIPIFYILITRLSEKFFGMEEED
ncbi:MAG: efflux RND transporter permease subunit [Candidatus Omnitrophica bacterium]|nr:efflux RND transporter permease subunit [Candidatus Omnitrophota bacterium]